MTWFAFSNGHPDINAAGAEEKLLVSYGFHGYATEALADGHKNSVNILQEGSLAAWDAAHATRVAGGAAGGSPADLSTAASGTFGTLAGFLGLPAGSKVSGKSLVIRGTKIIVGGLLLIIGLVHITGAGGAVASAARKVPVPI